MAHCWIPSLATALTQTSPIRTQKWGNHLSLAGMYNPITYINVFQYFAISRRFSFFFFLRVSFQGGCRLLLSKFKLARGSLVSLHSLSQLTDCSLRATEQRSTSQATGKSGGKFACTLSPPCPFCLAWTACPAQPMGVREAGQRTEHLLLTEKSSFSFPGYQFLQQAGNTLMLWILS